MSRRPTVGREIHYHRFMTGGDDVETRLSRLEHQVIQLQEHVNETHKLAAMNDRDQADLLGEVRRHRELLNAVRGTQLDQDRKLDEHGDVVASNTRSLERITSMIEKLLDQS